MSALNTILLLVHLLIALALVGVVLLQRSEGGALGIGGGGGGFLSGRGQANLLTRITATLAAAFFATSMLLTIVGQRSANPGSILDRPGSTAPASPSSSTTPPAAGDTSVPAAPAPASPPAGGGILDKLK